MRTIILNKMHIANFKGIQDLEIAYDGKNTLISGYNGTGKSTIAEAYFWTVTGKNTASAARFEVRPRNEQGNEAHDVITSVEVEFSVAEENSYLFTFTIRRDEREDVPKKAEGNLPPETIAKKKSYYFIDNAPYDEKTFYAQLAKVMCDKDKFAILSNPYAFFTLDEKVQRDLLTAACGDVADSKVDGYDKVKAICGAINTPITTRDSLKKSISTTKKRLEEIPTQIKVLLQNCDEYADYDKKIAELEKQALDNDENYNSAQSKLNQLELQLDRYPTEPSDNKVQQVEFRVKRAEECAESALRRSQEAAERKANNTCPNCGYVFNDNSADIERLTKEYEKYKAEVNNLKIELEKERKIQAEKMKVYEERLAAFNTLKNSQSETRSALINELADMRKTSKDLQSKITNLCTAQRVQSQIKSLRDEQRKLDDQLADDMTKLDTIEAFILRKAEKVVENINKRFTTVKFKLFEMQTNGELKPCCKAMKDGVSYANINTASKVQVGIEVSKLFSEFYGVTSPIFIDCAESIFDIPQTNAQIIRLKADETLTDRKLHIEVE